MADNRIKLTPPVFIITLLGLIAAVLAALLIVSYGSADRSSLKGDVESPILKVTFLYVGQGDAAVIRDMRPGGRVMLVDGGPSREAEEYALPGQVPVEVSNKGRTVVIPYLESENVERLDYVVATHKDGDHIGGIPYVIRNFPVSTVYDNGTRVAKPYYKDMLEAIKQSPGTRLETAYAGMKIPFAEGIECMVLSPDKAYHGTDSDENNSSVVIKVSAGDVSFLLTGDIEIPAELNIMGYGRTVKSTFIKVPHHGSNSSSSVPFIERVDPAVAIFSCGRYNKYGFPVLEIMRRYEEIGAKIYRTDKDGSIEVVTDGKRYSLSTER